MVCPNSTTLLLCYIGGRSYKNTLGPEEEDDSETEDSVSSLQWDPLSTDYLIMCNVRAGIRLIDTDSQSVIMKFTPPSAASSICSMSWINSAPGIFVTGGMSFKIDNSSFFLGIAQ